MNSNRFFTTLNVLGLSIGISCFIILLSLILVEISYDDFHQKAKRIYRIAEYVEFDGVGERSSRAPFPLGPAIYSDCPDLIESYVRIFSYDTPLFSIKRDNIHYTERNFYFADSTFFDVFDYPLALGDPSTALTSENQVIISYDVAQRYFGSASPIGKKLFFQDNVELTVTGVFEHDIPESHFTFDFICSFSTLKQFPLSNFMKDWVWNPCWTYVLLKNENTEDEVQHRLNSFVNRHFDPIIKAYTRLHLQRITDIHLHSHLMYEFKPNSDMKYVTSFFLLGGLILLIAGINFANFSTARSSVRMREMGIRKVLGAEQEHLIYQFITEALLTTVISILVSLSLLELLAPFTDEFLGTRLEGFPWLHPEIIIYVVLTGFIVGILSALYPAWYLSVYDTSNLLRSQNHRKKYSQYLREGLVALQSSISVFLLIGTLISLKQFHFLEKTDIGFDKENLLYIPISHTSLIEKYREFRLDLLQEDGIEDMSFIDHMMGQNHQVRQFNPENKAEDEYVFFPSLVVDPHFLSTLKIQCIAGRDFKEDTCSYIVTNSYRDLDTLLSTCDINNAVLVNEEMVRRLGLENPEDAIGKRMRSIRGNEHIVGVVEDFHFASLREPLSPLVIDLPHPVSRIYYARFVVIRYKPGMYNQAIEQLKKSWERYVPKQPLEFHSLEEQISLLYDKEKQLGQIAGVFSALAVLITCLGLFGLASFVVDQKRHEIGIRKALGASTFSVLLMLNRRFFILISVSCLVGVGFSWLITKQWLSNYAYHTQTDAWTFVWVSVIVLLITMVTVSVHTIRASLIHPVDAIRSI